MDELLTKLRARWRVIASLVVVSIVGLGVAAAFFPQVNTGLTLAFVAFGFVANTVMAGAAVWAVGAAKEWRDQMRGQALHDLALDVMTWARRTEFEWHRAIDLWRALGNVESQQLGAVNGHFVALAERSKELPALIARMEGLCGKGAAGPLFGMKHRVDELANGFVLDRDKRARHPHGEREFEPQASIMKARSGYFDLDGSKKRMTEFVEILADWASPHLGLSTPQGQGADEKRTVDLIERENVEAEKWLIPVREKFDAQKKAEEDAKQRVRQVELAEMVHEIEIETERLRKEYGEHVGAEASVEVETSDASTPPPSVSDPTPTQE